tara:strand:+ start:125 stop:622 length:498 start_codon:yes stop_codon:yes gene_type:complete
MEEILITKDMINKAKAKANQMGTIKNSITKGQGNIAGFIGEEIVLNYLNEKDNNSYDYDLILKDGRKVDVKTKRTTVKPRTNYDCSVAAFNTKQKCDVYIFCRILNDMSKGWILGYKDKEDYFNEARFMKKNEIDPANNFRVRADCYNVAIEDLESIDNLVQVLT